MPLATAQMVFDKLDLRILIDALDALISDYDAILAFGNTNYKADREMAQELRNRVSTKAQKLEG